MVKGSGARQRRLRIAPQVHHGRNACHRGGPGVFPQLCKNLLATMTKSARLAMRARASCRGSSAPKGWGSGCSACQASSKSTTKGSSPSTVRATHPGTQGRTSFSIPLGIEGKDAPERRAAPVIELFQVDIVQEWAKAPDPGERGVDRLHEARALPLAWSRAASLAFDCASITAVSPAP